MKVTFPRANVSNSSVIIKSPVMFVLLCVWWCLHQCSTVVSPLLMHWRHHIALNHWYSFSAFFFSEPHAKEKEPQKDEQPTRWLRLSFFFFLSYLFIYFLFPSFLPSILPSFCSFFLPQCSLFPSFLFFIFLHDHVVTIHSFIHPFINSFIYPFIHSFMHLLFIINQPFFSGSYHGDSGLLDPVKPH